MAALIQCFSAPWRFYVILTELCTALIQENGPPRRFYSIFIRTCEENFLQKTNLEKTKKRGTFYMIFEIVMGNDYQGKGGGLICCYVLFSRTYTKQFSQCQQPYSTNLLCRVYHSLTPLLQAALLDC